MVRSVLITGGNRGIGLEFVRQFLQDKSSPFEYVIAICRDPTNANDLIDLKQKHPKQLHVIELDVTNFEQYKAVVESVEEIVGKEKGLNEESLSWPHHLRGDSPVWVRPRPFPVQGCIYSNHC